MQVILLERIHHLGNLGDSVKVKPGYGRNFLIPYHKAVPATADNIVKFEARRAELEKAAAVQLQAAQIRAATMADLVIEIKAKASEEGKLYGSVGTREIADAIIAKGIQVVKSEVLLPHAIRQVGEHTVQIEVHSDVRVGIILNVVAE
jgi:large subunit ribosomal protein L9